MDPCGRAQLHITLHARFRNVDAVPISDCTRTSFVNWPTRFQRPPWAQWVPTARESYLISPKWALQALLLRLLNLEDRHSYKIDYSGIVAATGKGANLLKTLVGAGRFERPTPCAQGRCATRLRYAPTFAALLILAYLPIRKWRTPHDADRSADRGSLAEPASCRSISPQK